MISYLTLLISLPLNFLLFNDKERPCIERLENFLDRNKTFTVNQNDVDSESDSYQVTFKFHHRMEYIEVDVSGIELVTSNDAATYMICLDVKVGEEVNGELILNETCFDQDDNIVSVARCYFL